ncbi:acyltransferase [Kluyvera sp. CHPC 1.251]|uniref:acyltransferase n=1 Tax=Kluyvera sp. CHPC 1.251 TaxID=2995175 RepID=UPI002FD827A3
MTSIRQVATRNVTCGENVVIYEPANLYDCTLGDNVFIGPFVEIQGNTRIGANSKIQSHTFICEYVTVGRDCFIGHGVMFANDMFREGKPNADRESWGRITIGNNVSIGSGATILAVSICDGVVIGAGSVVTHSIEEKGVYAGNPARLLRRL